MKQKSPFIVAADWLEKHLGSPGLTIVDASWYLPAAGRNPLIEYAQSHIPGAIFFDQDSVCDQTSGLPHTLPDPHDFACHASAMGITQDDTIIVYDGPGFFSAPRVWWMFRIMGAKNVFVLDGGFDKWRKENRPITSEKTKIAPSFFHVDFQAERVVMLDEMRNIVAAQSAQIADARGAGRFQGVEAEPRAGMRSGHMPHAHNVPASLLSKDGELLPLSELRNIFEQAGIDPDKAVVTSCGSGVTAAVLTLALESLGNQQTRLYDGSWSEWGGLADTPVVTGE